MAQHASFFVLNSPCWSKWMRGGIRFASITDWIWLGFPAVMLDIVQHASFRIASFKLERRLNNAGRAPQLIITWVCTSFPVTMLPTDRRAGVWTYCQCGTTDDVQRYVNAWAFRPIDEGPRPQWQLESSRSRHPTNTRLPSMHRLTPHHPLSKSTLLTLAKLGESNSNLVEDFCHDRNWIVSRLHSAT